MEINNLQQLHSIMKANQASSTDVKPYEAQDSFKKWLNEALKSVNETQVESQVMTERLARGEDVNLHDVMITAQKASVTLQTTVEIRNKVIEAYQEVMRMQV